jgi:hypothetical protein
VLASRRGLGSDDLRYAVPEFLDAVHWALFAEKLAPELAEAREIVATDPPDELMNAGGSHLTTFMANRARARHRLAALEAALYPEDD